MAADSLEEDYEIVDLLGEGGMGTVHKVHHREWNVDLAMKSPRPELLTDEEDRAGFVHEAETWVSLDLHPHIVTCHYVRLLGGVPRIFIEFVDGHSLAEEIASGRLYRGGPSEVLERVLDVAIQAAWGLDAAHRHGVVHQDVKPSNLLVTSDGTVKVTDFGLARARALTGEAPGVTALGMTREYCSPEQWSLQRLAATTDVWSWAACLLEMYVGWPAWGLGASAGQWLEQAVAGGGVEGRVDLPAALRDLMRRCFARDPRERPSGMGEVVEALRTVYRQELGVPYPRPEPSTWSGISATLNSRALSFLDLGRPEDARTAWRRALRADPNHPESRFNMGLWRWRHGEITDTDLLQDLAGGVADDGDGVLTILRALVHVERGDPDTARRLRSELTEQIADRALGFLDAELARQPTGPISPLGVSATTSPTRMENVRAIRFSADGRTAVVARSDHSGFHSLTVQDTTTGAVLRRVDMEGEARSAIWTIAVDQRCESALVGWENGEVRLWDIPRAQRLLILDQPDPVYGLWLDPSGTAAVVCNRSQIARFDVGASRPRWATPQIETRLGYEGAWADRSGSVLVSHRSDRAELWSVTDGRRLAELPSHERSIITSAGIAADGSWSLIAYEDGSAERWHHADGRREPAWSTRGGRIDMVRISPSGDRALTCGFGDVVRLWDLTMRRCLRTFENSSRQGIRDLAWFPDGRAALVGGLLDPVSRWEMRSPVEAPFRVSVLRGRDDASRTKQLMDQAARAWQGGDTVRTLELVRQLRALPGQARRSEVVEAWRQLSGRLPPGRLLDARVVATHRRHSAAVAGLSLSPDGRSAVSADVRAGFLTWDLVAGREREHGAGDPSHTHYHVAVDQTGRHWFAVQHDGEIGSGTGPETLEGGRGVESSFVDWTGRVAVCAHEPDRFARPQPQPPSGTVTLWSVRTGRPLRSITVRPPATAAALTPDRRTVVAVGEQCIWIADSLTGVIRHERSVGGWRFNSLSLSHDGRLALAGDASGQVLVFGTGDGSPLRTLVESGDPASPVSAVAVTPDRRLAASAHQDGSTRLWDLPTGRLVRRLVGSNPATAVAVSADRQSVLVGHANGSLQHWALDWDLVARAPVDWDEGALHLLEAFLHLHVDEDEQAEYVQDEKADDEALRLLRPRSYRWTEADVVDLLKQLSWGGYGWLHANGVRRRLEALSTSSPG